MRRAIALTAPVTAGRLERKVHAGGQVGALSINVGALCDEEWSDDRQHLEELLIVAVRVMRTLRGWSGR